ncbi:MAG: Dyp-type peroxidase [Rhodocyclaceae bacterium]|nr:MAG: Dyp-type peroxidase [Rhodocyclaceae bacterium]
MNLPAQPAIVAPPPTHGASLTFRLAPAADARSALVRLQQGFSPSWGVAGLGEPLLAALGKTVPGLHTFTALSGPGCAAPSTQQALCCLLGSRERSAVFDTVEKVKALLGTDFVLDDAQDTFCYAGGRDLTGYEDGTENPKGDDAPAAALAEGAPGMAGSSFVAVQRWVHDLARFNGHPLPTRNAMIGRDRDSNEELADAPASAHVKRSAQESFEPPAFMLRRSLPWSNGKTQGLEFIAYGRSLQAYEQVLRRMMGLEDGIVDALFDFSRPLTGGYYWCPPVMDGKLNLRLLGI